MARLPKAAVKALDVTLSPSEAVSFKSFELADGLIRISNAWKEGFGPALYIKKH